MLNSCYSTWSTNVMHLENSALLFLMYKGGLVVLQGLSMYSCRRLPWNSQMYSSCFLVRDLSHFSTLDSWVVDLVHTPMSSSIFLFSCKTLSRTVNSLCQHDKIYLEMHDPFQKSSTGNSRALLNVFVYVCVRFPMTKT